MLPVVSFLLINSFTYVPDGCAGGDLFLNPSY